MGARAFLVAVAALALLAPPVSGEAGADAAPVQEAVEERCAPPCGYILPILDIVVDDKQACGGGRLIYAEGPPEDCDPLMADGESRGYSGKLLWYWELSEDGTYPKNTGEDIVISFSGTATNPTWLKVTVEGEGMAEDGTYVIDDAALFHPENLKQRQNAQGQESVWFWFERDIEITFTRDGDPTKQDLDRIENREGVQVFFLKGKSSASEPRFKEAFGVEEFRFNTCSDAIVAQQVKACPGVLQADGSYVPLSGHEEEAPALPLLGLLAAVGAALVLRRRGA